MKLIISSTSFTSPYHQIFSPNPIILFSSSQKCRLLRTISELHTPAGGGNYSPSIATHKVTVRDRQRGLVHETSISCILLNHRTFMFHSLKGCCTSCAVRVKSGQIRQPEALGISAELKSKGYALLCVDFPSSDLQVETQDEDEERDDYALELAMADE